MMNEIVNKLTPLFNFVDESTAKKKQPIRIKVDGKYIRLGRNQKQVWNTIGAAKSALRMHLSSRITKIICEANNCEPASFSNSSRIYYKHSDQQIAWQQFMEWGISTGFLEFEPV